VPKSVRWARTCRRTTPAVFSTPVEREDGLRRVAKGEPVSGSARPEGDGDASVRRTAISRLIQG